MLGDTYPYVTKFFRVKKTVAINFRSFVTLVSFFEKWRPGDDFIMQTRISFSVKLAHTKKTANRLAKKRRFCRSVKVIEKSYVENRVIIVLQSYIPDI